MEQVISELSDVEVIVAGSELAHAFLLAEHPITLIHIVIFINLHSILMVFVLKPLS